MLSLLCRISRGVFLLALIGATTLASEAPTIVVGEKGLEYVPGDRGDRVPDFSSAGYRGGGVAIPSPKETLVLEPLDTGADETGRIQQAIDELSARPVGEDGFRGVLLLKRGVYPLTGQLNIAASGVVVRGEGSGKDGTVLFAVSKNPGSFVFKIRGSRRYRAVGPTIPVDDDYVPVGATSLELKSTDGLAVGDAVLLRRVGNAEWIHAIGMDAIPQRRDGGVVHQWKAFDVDSPYKIIGIDGNRITLDAPLFLAIDRQWGGGSVIKIQEQRIERCGVENLRFVTAFDTSVVIKQHYADEVKPQTAIYIDQARDCWMRNIHCVHFDAVVAFRVFAFQCTVEDCAALKPVSNVTGGRRSPFNIYGSSRILMQRCFTEACRHPFVYGTRAKGPNVFLDCVSVDDHGASEPHMRWSFGGLYDNTVGNLSIMNRGAGGSGQGWAGANFVAWNTEGGSITIHSPPTANNWGFGCTGRRADRRDREYNPPGVWVSEGKKMPVRSLYEYQLEQSKGKAAVEAVLNRSQRDGSCTRKIKDAFAAPPWRAGGAPDWVEGYSETKTKMMENLVETRQGPETK